MQKFGSGGQPHSFQIFRWCVLLVEKLEMMVLICFFSCLPTPTLMPMPTWTKWQLQWQWRSDSDCDSDSDSDSDALYKPMICACSACLPACQSVCLYYACMHRWAACLSTDLPTLYIYTYISYVIYYIVYIIYIRYHTLYILHIVYCILYISCIIYQISYVIYYILYLIL